jgi:hypothetical protein
VHSRFGYKDHLFGDLFTVDPTGIAESLVSLCSLPLRSSSISNERIVALFSLLPPACASSVIEVMVAMGGGDRGERARTVLSSMHGGVKFPGEVSPGSLDRTAQQSRRRISYNLEDMSVRVGNDAKKKKTLSDAKIKNTAGPVTASTMSGIVSAKLVKAEMTPTLGTSGTRAKQT